MRDDLTIRVMTEIEVDLAVGWAAAEGWNPGSNDAALFRAADPDGFLIALEDDEPVAVLSVVSYGERFGFLGLYIVRPDRRRQGIGIAIWKEGVRRLGHRTIGLDGVLDQQANYRRSGFAFAHRNIRFTGTPDVAEHANPQVREWKNGSFTALADFDARYFPARRDRFLKGWLSSSGHRVFLTEDGHSITGYGVVRPRLQGFKIGPLLARSSLSATALFSALVYACGGAEVIIDVPEPNEAAVLLATRSGMKPVFETARMYRGPSPDLPLQEVFGITSFELG